MTEESPPSSSSASSYAPNLTRLVDYIAIFGLEVNNRRSPKGKLLQRLPLKDWSDTKFIEGIEFFCQPLGWQLTTCAQSTVPKFFQFVLTDIDGDRHYCACLTFYETLKNKTDNNTDTYSPKCIVLISRFDYREVFRDCLSILYSIHVNNLRYSLETLISNLLNSVKVPPFGKLSVTFSLTAGDCLTVKPPLTDTIPTTSATVYSLIENLGVNNVVELFCALLTEQKILFYSQSYARLNEACRGLIALMYPFKYSHTYIPILPAALVEFLSSPTPFIIGVHSCMKSEICDLLDVITVDIDGGSVKVPDSMQIAQLEEPYHTQLTTSLIHIFRPHLMHADEAFTPSSQIQASNPEIMDKEIRAIFLRTITQVLQGYRSCLTVIRIHPKPLITFHKASFLGQRGFVDNDFMSRLLDSMFFEKFVESRGLPYRNCDLFDYVHAEIQKDLKAEKKDIYITIQHIKKLAKSILECEIPHSSTTRQIALSPSEDGANLPLKVPFPEIDINKVDKLMNQSNETAQNKSSISPNNQKNGDGILKISSQEDLQFVPVGLTAEEVREEFNANEFVINSARRLEVMRNCVTCIFDNKISDARKALPAVLKALKNKSNRLALIEELACHLGSQRAVLEHQQFDLVVRLMNCALQHENRADLNGVAAKILPLAMGFCRRLCTGIIQFAYTCIQDHPVWSNHQFWESAFYLDVEKDIIALYKYSDDKSLDSTVVENGNQQVDHSASTSSSEKDKSETTDINQEDSALEVTFKRLKFVSTFSEEKQAQILDQNRKDEESTVYSQAMHYANRIVYMKVPLDISSKISDQGRPNGTDHHHGAGSSQRTHSGNDSDRNSISDEESGFEDESNPGNMGSSKAAATVVKFVTRFIDKVCVDCCIDENRIEALHTLIPQIVAMHIETLDSIYKESKRLPPVMKPKIVNPDLIDTECILMPGLRTYLLPDGRDKDIVKDESISSSIGGPIYLPAEGAIFITNYRVVFKGRPCDPFYCEQTVVRSFPITTVTKEKRIVVHDVPAVDQILRDGLQIRSNTFQLIRIAFDEEVSSESIETFRKHLNRQKSPANKLQLFAFTSQQTNNSTSPMLMPNKTKSSKSATLKGFAKRTINKTAQKVGLKKKEPNKNRIPAIVWEHPRNGAILLRSGGFQGKGVFDSIKKPGQTLYIMSEKSQIKNVKPELHKSCEFIQVELHEVRHVKNNFAKFLRACVPSAPISTNEASVAKQIETTDWFNQLKNILDCSLKMVKLLDKDGKSVLLSIEDNWEMTPQITSISLICLDAYYRTFEGFKALIEKEWLEFGHRFSNKTSYTGTIIASNFTLMFLQFLDLVHQIHRQFPLSFEFNQYYLKFLAYHQVSSRFSTFLLNSEAHRLDGGGELRFGNDDQSGFYQTASATSFGIKSTCSSSGSEMSEVHQGTASNSHLDSPSRSSTSSKSNTSDSKTLKPLHLNAMGRSFWEYAESLWTKSPMFFNYYYTPVNLIDSGNAPALKPCSNLALLKLWDYYIGEDLLHGPSYDIEVLQMAKQHQEVLQATRDPMNASKRRLVVSNYDCVNITQPDGLTQLIGDLRNIENEYNINSSRWSQLWSKIEDTLPS